MSKLEYELLKTEEIKPEKCPKCKNIFVESSAFNQRGMICLMRDCNYRFTRKEKVVIDNKKKTIQKVIYYK